VCQANVGLSIWRNGQFFNTYNIGRKIGFYYVTYTKIGDVAVWIPGANQDYPEGIIPGSSNCGGGNWCDPGMKCQSTGCARE